jgi:hypothetical protein
VKGPDNDLVAAEVLPCPRCQLTTPVEAVAHGVEEVRCERCSRLLRRRPAISAERRAQEMILRWAAGQLDRTLTTHHRRKPRGDRAEAEDDGVMEAVRALKHWARVIHKLPPLREQLASGRARQVEGTRQPGGPVNS